MNEILVNYEMHCKLTNQRYNLIGLSEEQVGCFKYEDESVGEMYYNNIHVSHFIVGDYIVVYNREYILKSDEVVYLFKDIGGVWN